MFSTSSAERRVTLAGRGDLSKNGRGTAVGISAAILRMAEMHCRRTATDGSPRPAEAASVTSFTRARISLVSRSRAKRRGSVGVTPGSDPLSDTLFETDMLRLTRAVAAARRVASPWPADRRRFSAGPTTLGCSRNWPSAPATAASTRSFGSFESFVNSASSSAKPLVSMSATKRALSGTASPFPMSPFPAGRLSSTLPAPGPTAFTIVSPMRLATATLVASDDWGFRRTFRTPLLNRAAILERKRGHDAPRPLLEVIRLLLRVGRVAARLRVERGPIDQEQRRG